MSDTYGSMLHSIIAQGRTQSTRLGQAFYTIGFVTEYPTGLLFSRPRMQRKLGWVEALQVIAGVFVPEDFRKAAPGLLWEYQYLDSGYGPRIAYNQIPAVIAQLQAFPETRRAVVHIGSAAEAGEGAKPCVSMYQFMIDEGKMDSFLYARSWDLVSGFVYDNMVIGLLSLLIADVVGVDTGGTFGFAANAHIYAKDIAEGRIPRGASSSRTMTLNRHFNSWERVQETALRELLKFRDDPDSYVQPDFVTVEVKDA